MGWRGKFVFLLMVYAAGFATAIYFLAPPPETTSANTGGNQSQAGSFDAQAFTHTVNSGLHKGVDFTKEIVHQTSIMIKEKIKEMHARHQKNS